MSENEFGGLPEYDQEEQKKSEFREKVADKLRAIYESAGFKPGAELKDLGEKIIQEPERSAEIIQDWLTEAQRMVDILPEAQKIKAQIGLVVCQAELLYRAKLVELGDEMIEQAIDLAYQMGFTDLSQELANL